MGIIAGFTGTANGKFRPVELVGGIGNFHRFRRNYASAGTAGIMYFDFVKGLIVAEIENQFCFVIATGIADICGICVLLRTINTVGQLFVPSIRIRITSSLTVCIRPGVLHPQRQVDSFVGILLSAHNFFIGKYRILCERQILRHRIFWLLRTFELRILVRNILFDERTFVGVL